MLFSFYLTFKHFSSSILLFFSWKETHMPERLLWQASMDRKSIMTARIPFKQHQYPPPCSLFFHFSTYVTLTQLLKIQFFFAKIKMRTDRHSRGYLDTNETCFGTWSQELIEYPLCVFFSISQPTYDINTPILLQYFSNSMSVESWKFYVATPIVSPFSNSCFCRLT